jgi:ABC-type sugar transport system permease subunit
MAGLHSKNSQINSKNKSDVWVATIFLLPAAIFFLVYIIYPIFSTFQYSLYEWSGLSDKKSFIGIQNFISAFGNDVVIKAIRNNFIFLSVGILIILPFSYVVALILSKGRIRNKKIFRTMYFFPVVLNLVVIGTIWGLFYNPQHGLLNSLLKLIGLQSLAQPWLGDQNTALIALLIVSVWMRSGYYIVVYMAGIESIPEDIWDALKMDGANLMIGAIKVIVPIMRTVIASTVTMALIYSINDFGMVWVMTRGGPVRATEILGTYMFKEAFTKHHMGYASAIVVIMLLVSLSVSIIQMRMFERNTVEY